MRQWGTARWSRLMQWRQMQRSQVGRWYDRHEWLLKSIIVVLGATAGFLLGIAGFMFDNPLGHFSTLQEVAMRHALRIELGSVWAIAGGLLIWGLEKIVAAIILLRTKDRTALGISLKWQKIMEAIALLTLASYFGLVLADYYLDIEFTILEQLVIATVIAAAAVTAAIFGMWFTVVLVNERRRRVDARAVRYNMRVIQEQSSDGEVQRTNADKRQEPR